MATASSRLGISSMRSRSPTDFPLLSSGNVAFVIVVCAAYASTLTALVYARRSLPAWEVAVLIGAGAAYLVLGTYGFTRCRRSRSLPAAATYFVIQLSLAS